MTEIRDLTPYEKEKWLDEYGRFEMGEDRFLCYGDELGEAFQGALYCTDKSDYGLSDWFVQAAQIQVLDMYYDQLHIYTDLYGGYETFESLGLPDKMEFIAKGYELEVTTIPHFGVGYEDKHRKLWDWAFENSKNYVAKIG